MSKEIAKRQESKMPASVTGALNEDYDAEDIMIPKLMIMQGLSRLVSNGTARIGQIIKSTTNDIVASPDEPAEFIPLTSFKTWRIEELVGNKFEYRRQEPITLANRAERLEWTGPDNTKWRRNMVYNFYILLAKEIEKELKAMKAAEKGEFPDPSDALMPCLVNFTRTAATAGKTLITHFAMAKKFNVKPFVSVFTLGTEMTKNDLGTFYTPMVARSRKATLGEIGASDKWLEIISKSNVEVEEDIKPKKENTMRPPLEEEAPV